jgi:hypothetical protein
MFSPLEIKIALHYCCHPDDYDGGRGEHWGSAPVQAIMKDFLAAGLLKNSDDDGVMYTRTDALGVWVDAICSVPRPVQKWVIPSSEWLKERMEGILKLRRDLHEIAMGPARVRVTPLNGDDHV